MQQSRVYYKFKSESKKKPWKILVINGDQISLKNLEVLITADAKLVQTKKSPFILSFTLNNTINLLTKDSVIRRNCAVLVKRSPIHHNQIKKQVVKLSPKLLKTKNPASVLVCPMCEQWMTKPMTMKCCFTTCCDSCWENYLWNRQGKCVCEEIGCSRFLNSTVDELLWMEASSHPLDVNNFQAPPAPTFLFSECY